MPRGIRRKGGKCSKRDNADDKKDYALYEINKDNAKLWEYYKKQGIIPEAEWDAFVESLKTELPTAFRIQGCHRELDAFVAMMKTRFFSQIDETEKDVHVPKQLPWLDSAFQTKMPRAAVRSHPILNQLHNFLVTEGEIGNVSRQEAVSMIPPLLLDVQPHHKVIDMCAAPGSKTMQLIEMMHADSDNPDGIVVANDADNSRCYLLVRQALKRMPAPSCVVINEDASVLPVMKDSSGNTLFFDRVLCDVICSGDGTFRKNIELWKSWTPQAGLGLHRLQVGIARRSLEILAVGGLMVYSTCSLNPIEDEAVLAELLRHFDGTVELMDVSDKLPELKRSPGISEWKVMDRDMLEFSSYDEVPGRLKRPIQKTMFPPTKEEAEKFHLERSFRVLPHAQDTGGFFVAVLTKTAHLHPKTSANGDEETAVVKPPAAKKRRMQGYQEDPFVFLAKEDERFKDITNYYGINSAFPAENLLSRTKESDQKRTLYFVNSAVRNFLQQNQDRVKVINAGVKMFGRTETKFNDCKFRLAQDGLKIILPYLEKRVVEISPDEMNKIMRGDGGNPYYPREKLQCDKALGDLQSGSVVLRATRGNVTKSICAWIGQMSVSPYISKEERIHVVRMLAFDTTDLEEEMSSKRKQKAEKGRKDRAKAQEANSASEESQDSQEATEDSQGATESTNGSEAEAKNEEVKEASEEEKEAPKEDAVTEKSQPEVMEH
uniref:tRNA (cytosine(34)-C(5))-methyltransferase n=1 Tax=Steinernema glaseri TaxID=37863 RepID=A0A1I8AL02_9BILA